MAAFGMPGGPEIWIILAVVLVIFGPTQLPKLAKMFGKSAKAMRDGMDGKLIEEDELEAAKVAEKVAEKAAEKAAEKPPVSDAAPKDADKNE